MSTEQDHPTDELQLLLDARLPPERQAVVEAHLRDCAQCRRELDLLKEVKLALRRGLPDHEVPAELRARISRDLAAADQASERRTPPRRWAVAGALAIAAGVVMALVTWRLVNRTGRTDAVSGAASDYEALAAGRLGLDLETTNPGTLEQHFTRAGLPFSTRVFDFGMMNYRLLGGRVHRLGGGPSALFAYQSTDGERVVCQMYEGGLESLPGGFEERENNGIRFRIYSRGRLTLVFWQEGSVVCALVADGSPEAAIQLAYAKAVKV